MNSVSSLLARSCSAQRSTPKPAGRTRLLSSNMNNKADPAHCRAFVLLIYLSVILAFVFVGSLPFLETIGLF
jgi:hypothetical protein